MAEPFNIEQYRQKMRGQVPHHPPQMQSPSMPPAQAQPQQSHQPQPYAPPPQASMPQMQPHQPQAWTTPMHGQTGHGQPMQQQQMQQMVQQAMPPVFAPPPNVTLVQQVEEASKKSKFKFKRPSRVKKPKTLAVETPAAIQQMGQAKPRSPIMVFMLGMACGMACFLAGNMVISEFLTDNSVKNFKEIEKQNVLAQQTVAPPQPQIEVETVAEAESPRG